MKRHPDVPHHAIDGTRCDLSELCSPEDLCDCKEKTPAERQLDEGPNGNHFAAGTEPKVTWNKDPLAICRMIVANPPVCPSWCTGKGHGLNLTPEGPADCLLWVHKLVFKVDQSFEVVLDQNQFLLDDVVEHEIGVRVDGDLLIDCLSPAEAEMLGRALIGAATSARGGQ